MKKLLIFAFAFVTLNSSVFASTLIYKGRFERKDIHDLTRPPEPVLVGDKFRQIRIVVARTTEPVARPAVGRAGFGIDILGEYENSLFNLASSWVDHNGTFVIDTPPPMIHIVPKNQIGTFAIFVWGS